jgi:hypothetical protein
MGVQITREMLEFSQQRSHDELFPCLYEGTTDEDCRLALIVETTNCCVTAAEYSDTNKTIK